MLFPAKKDENPMNGKMFNLHMKEETQNEELQWHPKTSLNFQALHLSVPKV